MVPPAPKRRRHNDDALRKPFKSPFRSPVQAASIPADSLEPSTRNDPASVVTPKALETGEIAGIPVATQSQLHAQKAWRPLAKRNPALVTLTAQITELRQTISTLEQASSLLSSDKSARLEALISKWRSASRAAAEELYATSRDRVNKMGGVSAWRERERERVEWQKQWDREEAREAEDGSEGEGGEKRERQESDYEHDLKDYDQDAEEEQRRVRELREGNDDDVG